MLHAGIKDKINVFHFERDTMGRAGVNDSGTPTPPFLVVASNDINEELNSGEAPEKCFASVNATLQQCTALC